MMSAENDQNISEQLKREIFEDFSPITPIIYIALETAQSIIPDCLDLIIEKCKIENEFTNKICAYLRPTLIRSIVQLILKSNNVETLAITEEKISSMNDDWGRLILSNNGLAGNYAQRNYRILKAFKTNAIANKLPPPGQSIKKQKYYCNFHLRQSRMKLFTEDIEQIPKHNAIYLWDESSSGSIFLYLACPKWGKGNKVSAYFIEPVEHPITLLERLISPEEITEELGLEKLQIDLDNIINPETENIQDGEISNESGQDNLWEQN